MELKKVFLNARMIIMLSFIVLAIFAINPHPFNKGVSIRSVQYNGSAYLAGMVTPKATAPPLSREIIVALDNHDISDVADYNSYLATVAPGQPVQVKTDKGLYKLTAKTNGNTTDLGLTVSDAPTSNIRKGLDLEGGTRILLQPEEQLSKDDFDLLLSSISERINAFGLTDVTLQTVSDLEGKKFIEIDIAGGSDQQVIDVISKQGKFEAKVGNTSVFKGGNDITYVCRSAECSGLSPYQAPVQSGDQWTAQFQFSIALSKDAAQRMADATKTLTVSGQYLSEPISLYLDDQLVDQLQISSNLRGQSVTDISISGPGTGRTEQESQLNALAAMKRLQTILITGSLPVKLDIVKIDTISPALGLTFTNDAIRMMFLAIAAVAIIIFIRYRKPVVAIPIMITGLAEVLIILGVAALIGWNLDVAAIAGILVAVGTGVDDQIVIVDESTSRRNVNESWIKRMKNAFFIIFAAYFAGVVSMIPLLFAGAGLLKGFAITSIVGITVGVFITRPAFAAVAQELLKDREQ